jgi:hypothetical protein
MSRPTRKTHDKSSDEGEVPSSPWRRKIAGSKLKKEKNYDRSQYVYENKHKYDNLSAAKGENFA